MCENSNRKNMKYIADFHIHSKYSRSTSKAITLEGLDAMAEIKGIDVMATGDFTHPAWFKEIESKLEKQDNGLLKLKDEYKIQREGANTDSRFRKGNTQFILSTEISCIYKKNDICRRVHMVIICSSVERVKKVNEYLTKKGFNLKSDGRPILGLDIKELAKIYLEFDDKAIIIPAHIWTPWFALFGSKSGYDSFEEAFEDLSDQIPAIETGLSSDPEMNWRVSQLNNKMILSNSDAHSLDKLGREANAFDFEKKEISYKLLHESIFQNKNLAYTIEFYPEEGKYHIDGHSNCNFSCSPEETKKHKGLCPKCGKKITVGVTSRVEELADQDSEKQRKKRPPYKSLVPLKEILAEINNTKSTASIKINKEYESLINNLGSEFHILLDAGLETIKEQNFMLSIAIDKMRKGDIVVKPGYDGVFGVVKIFSDKEREKYNPKQKKLF
ncbi:MAG: endonuclease Q family protein [Patescibacteria group bacterium]